MKVFTAKEFMKNPKLVYRTADREGKVRINHDHYDDKIFILKSSERHQDFPVDQPTQQKDC